MIISIISSIAAIGTGFMATLCCVGPATLQLVGLRGDDIGPWFAEHRIYNVTATIFLLGIAFYTQYGKNKKIEDDPDSDTIEFGDSEKRSIIAKRILWISYGLIMIFKLTPEVITFIYNH